VVVGSKGEGKAERLAAMLPTKEVFLLRGKQIFLN